MKLITMIGSLAFSSSLLACATEPTLGEDTQATAGSGGTTVVASRVTLPAVTVDFKSSEYVQDFELELKAKQPFDIQTNLVTYQPGGYSGWHTHPGPTIISVKSGTVVEYDGNDPTCTPHPIAPGTGTIEVHDTDHIHMVRNEGSTIAELTVTYLLPVGSPLRLDRPNPGYCPF